MSVSGFSGIGDAEASGSGGRSRTSVSSRAESARAAARGGRQLLGLGVEGVNINGRTRYRQYHAGGGAQLEPETPEVAAGGFESQRDTLLAQKKAQLESVIDRHDDLIREQFHMEHFTMMLSYNPAEAKADNSVVFKQFQANHDLFSTAAPPPASTRQTRRQMNERRQTITTPSTSAPPLSRSPAKRKAKKALNTEEIINIIASSRSDKSRKGKEKEEEPLAAPPNAQEPMASVSTPIVEESLKTGAVRRRVRLQGSPLAPATADVRSASESFPAPIEPPSIMDQPPGVDESISFAPPKRVNGKRRRDPSPPPGTNDRENVPAPVPVLSTPGSPRKVSVSYPRLPDESMLVNLSRRSGRLKDLPQIQASPKHVKAKIPPHVGFKMSNIAPPPPPPPQPPPPAPKLAVPPSPPKSTIKRIKLIVRRPPPTISHPDQRRPQHKHKSLTAFLSSYTLLDDEDVDPAALAQEAREEAEIIERVAQLRREGRYIPDSDFLFGAIDENYVLGGPLRETRDLWDDVVDEIVAVARKRSRQPTPKTLGNHIASILQKEWASSKARNAEEDKKKKSPQEELAKAAIDAVIAEWKKAVHHIHEKRRLEEAEEERRLSHAHLDAMLDQSGYLLATQQTDLARGDRFRSRSRSGSLVEFEEDEEEDSDDEEDEEEQEVAEESVEGTRADDSATEQGEGDEDGKSTISSLHDAEDREDESTTMLLGAFSPRTTAASSAGATRSGTPATTTTDTYPEQDYGASTAQLLNGHANVAQDEDIEMRSDTSSDLDLGDLVNPLPDSSPIRTTPLSASCLSPPTTTSPLPPPPTGSTLVPSDTPSPRAAEFYPKSVFSLSESVHKDVDVDTPRHPQSASRSITPNRRSATDSTLISRRVQPSSIPEEETEQAANLVDHEEVMDVIDDTANPYDGDQAMVEPSEQEDEEHDADDVEENQDQEQSEGGDDMDGSSIPEYLKPYAVAPVNWDPDSKVTPPLLLRGVLRPYQQSGLEWLASLHVNKLNGILADEMGLGKTIQTIALLAHLACDRGIWGPHLIIVPTSVLLNWEMEFKKFLPGFRVISYHGNPKRRKELRHGWNNKHHFNVCITSYTLASRDNKIFKRKAWYYMILDEAHMIKNFKSQRWGLLLQIRSYRRLLLTGTPLQNNLTELWALLQFLMSGANFVNLKEFGDWFSNPLEKAIEMGNTLDDDTMQRVSKLHTVLRPYLLRRLKRDVEKELPSKFEHLTLCPLSKRQRFLYDEFMSRAQTRDALQSGIYQKIANILMQLRKVCNHPDLFEVRPIVTSFAMSRSAIANFEIKELLLRRKLLDEDDERVSLNVVGLRFIDRQNVSLLTAVETRYLDATSRLPYFGEVTGEAQPKDMRTIAGFRKYAAYLQRAKTVARWSQIGYLNKLRCSRIPIYSSECISVVQQMSTAILPFSHLDTRLNYLDNVDRVNKSVKSCSDRAQEMVPLVNCFAFVTPAVVSLDMPRIALSGFEDVVLQQPLGFDEVLHQASVKLQIAFPDASLLQYDCGKLQELATLLREKKSGGHRILIFTQMTRVLDILEIFLNFHGYLYLRLDGATKIEDRQYITERFNADPRIFCFISSSRSGGVGINLTGADTVIFYDSDFNPQMDRQCEDRAHRIGQIRDVHIYRFVSRFTVEEAMLRKANQKRHLDDLVIQKGEFDWRSLFNVNDESALTKALANYEDVEDRHAAAVAAREEFSLVGADEADFSDAEPGGGRVGDGDVDGGGLAVDGVDAIGEDLVIEGGGEEEEEGGTVVEYMLAVVERDWEFFTECEPYV